MTEHLKPTPSSTNTAPDGKPELDAALSDAKQEGQDALNAAKMEADRTADKLRNKASEAWYDAYETASDRVSGVADDAARHVSQQARATRTAADEQPAGSAQKQVLSQASAVLESTAAHLRHTDLDAALADMRGFARRRPALFLAGAAALGFFAARVARASSPEQDAERDFYTPSELGRRVSG